MLDPLIVVEQLGASGSFDNLSGPLQIALFLGALALLPALLVCMTPFTRIIIVLSFVRRAVTSQDIPPNLVLLGLSFFLTLFVMAPTLEEINAKALMPYLQKDKEKSVSAVEAVRRAGDSMKKMMLRQTRRQDLALFIHMAGLPSLEKPEDTPFHVLVPAYVISELKTAFIMGFLIYVPFLLVDLVVASILTAMGMLTMPPVIISAPCKLMVFVLADGWHLVVRAIGFSFG